MDPHSVLKLMRQQRRQIGAYNPSIYPSAATQIPHDSNLHHLLDTPHHHHHHHHHQHHPSISNPHHYATMNHHPHHNVINSRSASVKSTSNGSDSGVTSSSSPLSDDGSEYTTPPPLPLPSVVVPMPLNNLKRKAEPSFDINMGIANYEDYLKRLTQLQQQQQHQLQTDIKHHHSLLKPTPYHPHDMKHHNNARSTPVSPPHSSFRPFQRMSQSAEDNLAYLYTGANNNNASNDILSRLQLINELNEQRMLVKKLEEQQLLHNALNSKREIEPESCDDNELVTISKKMLPMVSAKINDWLDKCTGFAVRIMSMYAGRIDVGVIERLVALAWPRLLLTYMMEHSFDFCVTRLHAFDAKEANRREALAMPRQRDATHLLQLIAKGYALGLTADAYEYLREIILFKEAKDGGDSKCHVACQEAHRKLRLMLPDQKTLFKLLLFLPSIYNVNTEIVRNLFCSSVDFESSLHGLLMQNSKRPMLVKNSSYGFGGSCSSLLNSNAKSSISSTASSSNMLAGGKQVSNSRTASTCSLYDDYRSMVFGLNSLNDVNLSVNNNQNVSQRASAGGMNFKLIDDGLYESVAAKIKQEETIVKQ